MSAFFLPTKVRLRRCTIKGVDMRAQTHKAKCFETMCKPYLTAEITIIDQNNTIDSLGLVGGEPINLAIDAGENVYEQKYYIHSVEGQPTEENPRAIVYNISCVGESYMKDRSNMVQDSAVNVTATSVARKIHETFAGGDAPLNILMESSGMVAMKDIGSYITTNQKPFKAIEDVLKRANFGSVKSNSPVYFRSAKEYIIGPLETIFAQAGVQQSFIQKQTWGTDWRDLFTSHNAVIAASTVVKDGKKGGNASVGNMAAAMNQATAIYDNKLKKLIQEFPSKAIGGISTALGQAQLPTINFSKKMGGLLNVKEFDSARNPISSDPAINSAITNMFQAQIKDGTNYYIKVPIKSGLKCTVGKGIHCKLIPPVGDQQTGGKFIGGQMLVADLCHECWFDDRTVQATTTFRTVKTGINK